MTPDSTRVVFHLERGLGLVAAIRSAVHFEAARAGLDDGGCRELGEAFEDACRQALLQLPDAERGLEITIESFADRIEISISYQGPGNPAFGVVSGGEPGRSFASEDGSGHMTLVKLFEPKRLTPKRKKRE